MIINCGKFLLTSEDSMNTCHSQLNTYGAKLKCWNVLGSTKGERTAGRCRTSTVVPEGDILNSARTLTKAEAIYIAMQQPGGGVIHCYNGNNWNVYAEVRILRYKEILGQLKRR